MSLGDQSQKWFPTSVQVTVQQARNLRAKGKNGTNDAYAIIQVAKDKFSTTVAEKSVAPVWKEEASFDLPLFHPGNAERCTLNVIVMHRAQIGLDKLLGKAVVNLVDLHDNKSRKKTDWFKLVDKAGKEDKPRGEVLLDIQFMRNNMSASMFDLSMQDKPRSRLSKLKGKVRGKKKDGFSDSASAIVPHVSQVLTDSEAEADAKSLNQSPGVKKKSKLKSLFAPKSNLQRNISQSMSTLGTLPEKNSSLSGSRSSGLNADSPEGKHKLKFLGHKRTGSSDSKVSQGPFSLLGRSKQSNNDQNNLCINGSHVYAEEAESKSGSTVSLSSSGQGSVEDMSRNTFRSDPFKTVPSIQGESDRARLEQQRHQEEEQEQEEEEKKRQTEERRIAEAKGLEEEEKYRLETERLQEEQERRRRVLEDEVRRKKQKEEDDERKKQEEGRRMLEAAENQRLEEERCKVEEQKKQEEASMTDRLTALFGIIRKKEDKKEEVQQHAKEELPMKPPRADQRDPNQPVFIDPTNPFEDIPLTSDRPVNPDGHQKSTHNPQTPSAVFFLNRATKVSAVKPRFTQSLESETTDCQTPSQLCPSPATSETTLSSVPSESPDTFSILHSSLAPANISQNHSGFPGHIEEDLSVGSLPAMADKKKRAPLPPSHPVHGTQLAGNNIAVREINSPTYSEGDGSHQGKQMSIPLPDYDTLFPQKRHGVQGITRWDHIIAEVNQRHRDSPPELVGQEMSVDGPVGQRLSPRPSVPQESPAMRIYQPNNQETPPVASKKVPPPLPAKAAASPYPRPAETLQRKSQNIAHPSPVRTTPSAVPGPVNTDLPSRETPSLRSRHGEKKLLPPPPAPTPVSQTDWHTTMQDDQRKVHIAVNQEETKAKPRERANEPVEEVDSAVPIVVPDKYMNSNLQTLSTPSESSMVNNGQRIQENFAAFDPFPSMDLLPNDPWAQVKMNQQVDDFSTGSVEKEQKFENRGMTAEDLDNIFLRDNRTDPFASFNGDDANTHSEYRGEDIDLKKGSPAVVTRNSERQNPILPDATQQDFKTLKYQQEPTYKEETSKTTANNGFSARDVSNEFSIPRPQPDVKISTHSYGREDPFVSESFNVITSFSPREPLEVVMEEPEFQAGNLSGGKTPLRAWVSPSEVQHVSAQNSSGGGLALPPRRPHPVKPMHTVEIQQPIGQPPVRDTKIRQSTPRTIQVAGNVEGGPYTQLTQEELITLVVKQQTDLSRKDTKIIELEEYIDNLLVRVIEEKPSILNSLDSLKPM